MPAVKPVRPIENKRKETLKDEPAHPIVAFFVLGGLKKYHIKNKRIRPPNEKEC